MRRSLPVLVIIAAFLISFFSQLSIDRSLKINEDGRSYLLVPPLKMVQAVACGFQTVISDGFWLNFLQYNGEKLVGDRPYKNEVENLVPLFSFITGLDPRFTFAYQFGAWVLADSNQTAEAVRLLDRGFAVLPNDPMIPFQRGFVEFLFRHDYLEAARWFMLADRMPGCPLRARRMAAAMYAKGNKNELAREIWLEILKNSNDGQTQRIAARAIEKLERAMKRARP